jgi:hypothetical protein
VVDLTILWLIFLSYDHETVFGRNGIVSVRYGLVWVSHFSKTGLLFKIETSKSRNSLVLVSVVFLGLILVSNRSLWVSLWSSKRSYLVSFRSILGLAQGETKTRPRRKTQTRPSKPQLDPNETHSRPKGDLFATSVATKTGGSTVSSIGAFGYASNKAS